MRDREELLSQADTRFPPGFLWGAATSAYQVEGSPLADGAGPGIWHRFTHSPGRVKNGDTGDIACDHYRRWEQDVELMAGLGLGGYRFGLSWGRILPRGTGRVNPAGIDFYSRLIDRLLERGIRPLVTLYHWDLPAALDDRGGWLNRDVIHWFTEFAEIAFEAFGDRVDLWATLNEPWVIVDAGYLHGINAPGHRDLEETAIATRHLMCAHGSAVRAFRQRGRGAIGLVVNLEPKYPASDRPEDVETARLQHAYNNQLHVDPVLLGRYPDAARELFGDAWREPPADDLALAHQPVDFLGVNYYTRRIVKHESTRPPMYFSEGRNDRAIHMTTGWELFPAGLTRTLLEVRERYGNLPIYITENGAPFYDPPSAIDGRVEDPLRVHCLRENLLALHAAIRQGVDVRGYFVWSLLDNFEWASGYSLRFGIVHVDFATQQRTVKASGHWYREVIQSNGAKLAEPLPTLRV
jgi:beta-glucosidase